LEAAPAATSAVVPLVTNVKARAKATIKSLPKLLETDPEKARAALRDAGISELITLRPATDGPHLNAEFDLEVVTLAALGNGVAESMVGGGMIRNYNHGNLHEIFFDHRCKPFAPRARVTGYSF